MSFANIQRKLAAMDYNPWHLSTYVGVLTPGLSLLVQKIHLAAVLPFINGNLAEREARLNPQTNQNIQDIADAQAEQKSSNERFVQICRWHSVGSLAQMLGCVLAIEAFALPVFALIAIPGIIGFATATYYGLTKNLTDIQYSTAGNRISVHQVGMLRSSKFVF